MPRDILAEEVERSKEASKAELEQEQSAEIVPHTVDKELLGSYQGERENFMSSQVAEGIQCETNAETFEDLKQYYDERLKVADAAGKQIVPKSVA
jgi:hypothetical protein